MFSFRGMSETPATTTSQKVSQYTSNLYCSMPLICIAVRLVPLRSEERETLSVLLPFVSQYASHLYRNMPPISILVLLGKSWWWWWSPGCSPLLMECEEKAAKTLSLIDHLNLYFVKYNSRRACPRNFRAFLVFGPRPSLKPPKPAF